MENVIVFLEFSQFILSLPYDFSNIVTAAVGKTMILDRQDVCQLTNRFLEIYNTTYTENRCIRIARMIHRPYTALVTTVVE